MSGSYIRNQHWNKKWRNSVGLTVTFIQVLLLMMVCPHSSDTGTNDYTNSLSVKFIKINPCIFDSHTGRRHCILCKQVHSLGFFKANMQRRVIVLDFTSERSFKFGSIKPCYRCASTFTFY